MGLFALPQWLMDQNRLAKTPSFLGTEETPAQGAQGQTADPFEVKLPEKAARMATPPQVSGGGGAPVAIAAPTGPNLSEDVYRGRVAEPNPADYHGPTGWKGALDKVARVMLGSDYDRAVPSAQDRYARDEGRYNSAWERGRQETADENAEQARMAQPPTTRQVEVNGQPQIQDWDAASRGWKAEPNVAPYAKPTAEKAGEYKFFTVPGSTQPVAAREDESGNLIQRDGKPLPMNATPYKDQGAGKSDFDNYYAQWLKDNKKPDTAENRLAARKLYEEAGREPDTGTWGLAEDGQGNPVEINSKNGQVRPAPQGVHRGNGPGEKLNTLQQQTTTNLRGLDVAHEAGKLNDADYQTQAIAQWKTYAQGVRRLGQVPSATVDLGKLYLARFGDRAKAEAAMKQDGWEIPKQ